MSVRGAEQPFDLWDFIILQYVRAKGETEFRSWFPGYPFDAGEAEYRSWL